MTTQHIGILHPGEMGISIAAAAQNSGHQVFWASTGRGSKTAARAAQHGLIDAGTVAKLCAGCSIILSVCPPHAAEEVAHEAIGHGFRGLYLDANAIAPARAQKIGHLINGAGAAFVDGGIIGGPAWKRGTTWLYLSGERADEIAACFAAGPLESKVIGTEIGKASALKMCYAAYSKGTTALISSIVAAADTLGVGEELFAQWANDDATFPEQTVQRVRRVTAKAWRFVGEMEEIAATLRSAGQPGEFHDAAAEVYQRMAGFKDAGEVPCFEDVLAALQQKS